MRYADERHCHLSEKRMLRMRERMPCFPVVILSLLALSGCGGGSANSGEGGGATPPPNASDEWAWMRGAAADLPVPVGWSNPWSEPYNSDSYYGTLGTPGAHTVPGGRNSSAYWSDSEGNFWLFGGDGLDGTRAPIEGLLNDLWKFSPATNEWTWMGGSNTLPSSFQSCAGASVGHCGLPGVYGTLGAPSLSNIPGGREMAVTWADSKGNFWLFGGAGADSAGSEGYLNDLWEFTPSTGEWTWISGSNTVGSNQLGQEGSYGTRGAPAPGNFPPGLIEATGWIDKNDNLFLFGGAGVSSAGDAPYQFNNLWEFSPATTEWTWISGNGGSENLNYGVYGTQGTPATGNLPPGRHSATGWTDASGNFWLFGGYGILPSQQAVGVPDGAGILNDLWEFNPASEQWTWIAGAAGIASKASYGTPGVAASSNLPGGRMGATSWVDDSGNLWLFGGEGFGSTSDGGVLNDLWKFSLSTKQWTWMKGSSIASQGGDYGVAEGTPGAANTPGGRYNSASWMDHSGNLWLFAGWGNIDAVTGGSTALNDLWRYQP